MGLEDVEAAGWKDGSPVFETQGELKGMLVAALPRKETF